MNESMNLKSEKPTFGRSAKIGSILAEKPHSAVPHRLAEQMAHRAESAANRPRRAALVRGHGLQGCGSGQMLNQIGRPRQPTNPLLVAGPPRERPQRVLRDKMVGPFGRERSGSSLPSGRS